MIRNLGKKEFRRLDIIIGLLLGTIIIGGILTITHAIESGYHFVDDHELIRIEQAVIKKVSFKDTLNQWLKIDMNVRFRPLYWLERIGMGYLFGCNLLAFNIWTTIKGIFAFTFLYVSARLMKYNRCISIIFPMIIMLGPQFTPWYRSANQESTGVLLCAAALMVLAIQYHSKKYTSWIYNLILTVLSVLMGLVKESFTLFMLIVPILKMWLEYWDDTDISCMNTNRKRRLIKIFKENALWYICILIAFIVNIYIILFYVGVDKVGYAGFHRDTGIMQYVMGIKSSLLYNMRYYTLLAGIIVFMIILCLQLIEKHDIKKYLSLCVILTCAMAIQLIAHAKSGMWERYLFPYIIAYMLLVLIGYRIFENSYYRSVIYILLLVALLWKTIPIAIENTQNYAESGEETQAFLNIF